MAAAINKLTGDRHRGVLLEPQQASREAASGVGVQSTVLLCGVNAVTTL
jgi:hypothetical protein